MRSFLVRYAPAIILALAFIGLADAAYLAQSALSNTPLLCNLQGLSDCNIVAQSVYSHLFGIPLGVFGLMFYGVLFALAAVELVYTESLVRKGIQIVTTTGVLASVGFEFLQIFVIKALCVYCALSALLALLLWLVSLTLSGFTLRRAAVPAALLLILCSLAATPTHVSAATFNAQRSLVVSEVSDGNAYFAAGGITVVAPIAGDLSVLGGSISVSAPVAGDALLAGGSMVLRKPVTGDARLLGGNIVLAAPVGGDLVACAGTFAETAGTAKTVFVIAGSARLLSGASGPVTVYGSDVYLGGNFASDVRVVASNRLTLAPDTHIQGRLRYEAPQVAEVPDSAIVDGGVVYTGASFLPSSQQAHALALAGTGVFLFVKILGALIAVGLLAGLFPVFTERVAGRVLRGTLRRFALYALLGFAFSVATPILVFLLAVTFVGLGVALIIGSAYLLALSLAFCYAGAVAGTALREWVFKRRYFSWRYPVFGMLILSLVYLVPVVGPVTFYVVWVAALGALISDAYERAFGTDE